MALDCHVRIKSSVGLSTFDPTALKLFARLHLTYFGVVLCHDDFESRSTFKKYDCFSKAIYQQFNVLHVRFVHHVPVIQSVKIDGYNHVFEGCDLNELTSPGRPLLIDAFIFVV